MASNALAFLALCLALSLAFATAEETKSLARGFNDNIEWKSLDEGLALAAETGKPLMVLIHKTWCGACKKLKTVVEPSKAIEEKSKDFIMVNLEDDEEPNKPEFQPDGGYIPRILFLESNGNVRSDLLNVQGNPKYKYYYSSEEQILAGMDNALNNLASKKEL